MLVWGIWAASAGAVSAIFPPGQQARAAALQIVMIGVALCAILLLRPRGILGEERVVSRHLGKLAGRTNTAGDADAAATEEKASNVQST